MEDRAELVELWQAISHGARPRFRRFTSRNNDFNTNVFSVMHLLHQQPGITLNQLARTAGIVKSHASRTIDALVEQGLVEKRPDDRDARLVRLYPTPALPRRFEQFEARAREVWAGVFEQIPEAQVAPVAAALRTVLHALEQANRAEAPDSD